MGGTSGHKPRTCSRTARKVPTVKWTREAAFWMAVGLAGAATIGILKAVAGRFRLPAGLESTIAAL